MMHFVIDFTLSSVTKSYYTLEMGALPTIFYSWVDLAVKFLSKFDALCIMVLLRY